MTENSLALALLGMLLTVVIGGLCLIGVFIYGLWKWR